MPAPDDTREAVEEKAGFVVQIGAVHGFSSFPSVAAMLRRLYARAIAAEAATAEAIRQRDAALEVLERIAEGEPNGRWAQGEAAEALAALTPHPQEPGETGRAG